jgi:predicted aspartyl protease
LFGSGETVIHRRRHLALSVFGLAAVMAAGPAHAAAEPPRIAKPRPAPLTPGDVAPLPPAEFDNGLAIGGNDVKARKVDTRLQVEVQVNGRGPYHFVVDSGADSSVVGLRIARDLQLPLGTPAVLSTTTSRDIVDRVKVAELTVGSTSFHDLQLPALREADIGSDGLVGLDGLVQQRLLLDFDKKVIKVEDASIPMKAGPDDIVIIARRRRGQLIVTQIYTNGFRLDAVIDTGSEVTIGNSALRDKLLRSGHGKLWTVPATGVTGVTVNLQFAMIDELQVGPVTIRDVPIAFADVPPFAQFGLADHPALLLGTDLLENFRRVSLDFRARKIRFQLRRCEPQNLVISTAPTNEFSRMFPNSGTNLCS